MKKHTCHFDLRQTSHFRHDWTRGEVSLGSTVDQQPEEKLLDSQE